MGRMIYVMHEPALDLHKIGVSRDPGSALRERLPDIRRKLSRKRGEHVELVLVRWVPWTPSAEMQIHRYLWQLWAGDEWFSRGPALERVLAWTERDDYFGFKKAFREAEPTLPRPWHWKNRDRVIAEHATRQHII